MYVCFCTFEDILVCICIQSWTLLSPLLYATHIIHPKPPTCHPHPPTQHCKHAPAPSKQAGRREACGGRLDLSSLTPMNLPMAVVLACFLAWRRVNRHRKRKRRRILSLWTLLPVQEDLQEDLGGRMKGWIFVERFPDLSLLLFHSSTIISLFLSSLSFMFYASLSLPVR